jgi:mucin-19
LTRARDVASALSGALSSSDAVSQTLSNKTIDGNDNTIVTKRGGTSSRPSTPTTGTLYYNTDDDKLQIYDAGWTNVYQAPAVILSGISPSTAATTGTSITISGSYIQTGATVKFIGSDNTERSAATVSVTSGDELVATTPSLPVAYEPYDVKVTNPDGQNATLSDALDAGGTPTWNTASGTLSTIDEGTSLSTSVSATDPDGTSIVYSSSNLPSWMSLNSSTGALTGTGPDIESNTTYNFNITASDGVNTSSRAFSVIVSYVPPFITTDFVLIGGGGGGGGEYTSGQSGASGGGAGGYRSSVTGELSGRGASPESAINFLPSTNYTVTIGAGGPGGANPSTNSTGSNSSISGPSITTVTSLGGGAGSYRWHLNSYDGGPGGSGGGGSSEGAGGAGTTGQGYNGANASGYGSRGAGGGGAGSAGSGFSGGTGVASSITGSSVTRAYGGSGSSNGNPGAAAANTGNGGDGGFGYNTSQRGGAGGSGVAIFKYPSIRSITVSGGLTHSTSSSGGYKVTTITAGTGTVSFA